MFYIILESSNNFMQGILNQSFIMLKYACKTTQSMNKLTIPSILAATVLIAGIFAFMPVEKASTIHVGLGEKVDAVQTDVDDIGTDVTNISDNSLKLFTMGFTDADLNAGDTYTLDCNKAYTVIGIFASVAGLIADESLTVSTGGVNIDSAFDFIAPGGHLLINGNIPVPGEQTVVLTAAGTDDGEETANITISVLAPSDAMCKTLQTDNP